ncbi:MAG: bifunctional ornithine acetyltransferase/N-acetylglutamate synthase [Candidatus Altiarchaeota archaeon]|nr:bifunctional ornithine acetyltransferase/N-acetylglutamate synthase [Candidatus Altiarchaeota archaeon]
MTVSESDDGICIGGFTASGARKGKYALALIVAEEVCRTAGVFTRNKIKASPVLLDMEKLDNGFQAIAANSGNANACVKEGMGDAEMMCHLAAEETGVREENIAVASTGIIGRPMDMNVIGELIKEAAKTLSDSPDGSSKAAKAIMTTDTMVKELSIEYEGIRVGGIAKGAGMISPDMATMLCFISTNADLERDELQDALGEAVDESFNMLVIDGDMSTNDMVLLLSNHSKKCSLADFKHALKYFTKEMAKKMALDGEGATKYLEVEVKGAGSREAARRGARSIASSSLVKTALYGENPNWGRITAALGSVTDFLFEETDIIFESSKGRTVVLENAEVGDLKKARQVLEGKEIKVTVDLNMGDSRATAYGCDLTPEYVEINAGYS